MRLLADNNRKAICFDGALHLTSKQHVWSGWRKLVPSLSVIENSVRARSSHQPRQTLIQAPRHWNPRYGKRGFPLLGIRTSCLRHRLLWPVFSTISEMIGRASIMSSLYQERQTLTAHPSLELLVQPSSPMTRI